MLWDVFISHASEDKDTVARPLAVELEAAGLRVWFDETQLKIGDSLRAKIDEGLSKSRFGVVIISPAFLAKRWPQRELGGFFARGSDREVVLPIWHDVSSKDVFEASPMLADLVAASTAKGIAAVAAKIIEVAAPYLQRPDGLASRGYSANVEIPAHHLARAVEVFEVIAQPSTWPYLSITAPDYPRQGWLGSDSGTLIEILYGFAAPLVAYRALSYSARRNAALLSRKARLSLALVQAALEVFTNEALIASTPPQIAYSPRVPNWRSRRITEPARYWWQGLSPDRFDDVRSIFLRQSSSCAEAFELVPPGEFRGTYESLYASSYSDARQSQALGLLGNGFFGFTPRTRPVLWRVIVCQSRLYQAALGRTLHMTESETPGSLNSLFEPNESSRFPYAAPEIPESHLFESFDTTFSATTTYLNAFVVPRLQAALAAPSEE